jgi:hypothetical protein
VPLALREEGYGAVRASLVLVLACSSLLVISASGILLKQVIVKRRRDAKT